MTVNGTVRSELLAISVCALASSLATSGCGEAAVPPPKAARADDATGVLRGSETAYSRAVSYSDSGVVVIVFNPEDGSDVHVSTTIFRTRYKPHHAFRFEYHDASATNDDHYGFVLSTPAGTWKRAEGEDRVESVASAADAVASLAGVTSGAVTRTFELLTNGSAGWRCRGEDPGSVAVVGLESVADVQCVRVRLSAARCEPVDVWIANDDHMLRKISTHSRNKISKDVRRARYLEAMKTAPPEARDALRRAAQEASDTFYSVETTIYLAPRTDRPIDESEFSPPP